MSLVSSESSPSQQTPTTPLQPINCQINLPSCIKPSVSSAFSIVPSSSVTLSSSSSLTSPTTTGATGASVATKRRHSDAGYVFSSAIGKDSTDSSTPTHETHLTKSTTSNAITTNKEDFNGNELSSNEIALVDKLSKTTSIWFLPDSGRSNVTHLLEEKEEGCFIVRNSSKLNSMALSVRLPEGKGPHVEHYLIEGTPNGILHLEGSENFFSNMTTLIAHYCNVCDELPVQLTLPRKLMNANFVKLTSYSLLGQEFWHTLNQTPHNNNSSRTFAPINRSASNISTTFKNNNNLNVHLSVSIKQQKSLESKIEKISHGTSNNNKFQSPDNNIILKPNYSLKKNKLTNLSLTTNNLNSQTYIVNELTSSGSSTNLTNLPSSSASSASTSSCSPTSSSPPSRFETDDLLSNFNDPIVDMKKSSTVPINLADQCDPGINPSVKITVPPKPPPRASGFIGLGINGISPSSSSSHLIANPPPPVPSRTSKPSPKPSVKSLSSTSISSFIKSISIEDMFQSKNQPITSDDELLIVKEEEEEGENDDDDPKGHYYLGNKSNERKNDVLTTSNNKISNNAKDNLNSNPSQGNYEESNGGSQHDISSQNESNNGDGPFTPSPGQGERKTRGIDTLIKYYNSKVEDKFSDYEDIWSFAPRPFEDRAKHHLSPYQQSEDKKAKESQKALRTSQHEPQPQQPQQPSRKLKSSSITTTKSSSTKISSDALNNGSNHHGNSKLVSSDSKTPTKCCSTSTQTEPMMKSSSSCDIDEQFNVIVNRLENHSHYGSDSNLTLCSVRSNIRAKHNLSLESLIYLNKDALSIYGDPSEPGFPRGEFNSINPHLEDASTQFGNNRSHHRVSNSSSSSKQNQPANRSDIHRATQGNGSTIRGKDGAWLVDSSWKWRRSNVILDQSDNDASNNDTDDTTLTLRSPLRRNKRSSQSSEDKRTLDQERADLNRYRRFSARYVLESGVDSEPDLNEVDETNDRREERKSRTVEDLIALEAPELRVPKIELETNISVNLGDSYDNVVTFRKHDKDAATRKANREDSSKTSGGTMTDTETVFSEPWDSEYWRKLITVTPGKTELLMSLSPEDDEREDDGNDEDEEEEIISIYDHPGGSSPPLPDSLIHASSSSSSFIPESTINLNPNQSSGKVKKYSPCNKQRNDKLDEDERLSSLNAVQSHNNNNNSAQRRKISSSNTDQQPIVRQHQRHNHRPPRSRRRRHPSEEEERDSLEIPQVTSFTPEVVSELLSSISMHDQSRISMNSTSSNPHPYPNNAYKPSTVTSTTTTIRNERIYSAGKSICDYIFELIEEGDNTFAKSVSHFIDCTKDLHHQVNPHTVMRNIRQFMNGMKNYLVKHGEKNFLEMIREERNKLRSDEFLNIDAIIEGTLHKLIIKPLKSHLDSLFVDHYKSDGSLIILSENMKRAQKQTPVELGIRSDLYLPDTRSMAVIQKHFIKMQRAYSPLKKLEHLLAAISSIYSGVKNSSQQAALIAASAKTTGSLSSESQLRACNRKISSTAVSHESSHLSIGADDFLPIFIYVLVHCGFLSAEIEAEYMWGLLHPSLLSGEGGYYLTTLSSCLHVIKNMSETEVSLSNQTSSPHPVTTASPGATDEHNVTASTTLSSVTGVSMIITSSPQSTSPPATPSISGLINATGTTSSSSLVTSSMITTPSRLTSVTDLQGYMKIMIPNELSCSIVTKTLPVRPSMTTKEVCKMIAHKFNQINSEDYGLFQITSEGCETQLEPTDLPQEIRSEATKTGKPLSFAYKRIDVKFVWPKMDDP